MRFLFGVTTCLPDLRHLSTYSLAGSMPPIDSITSSISGSFAMTSISGVMISSRCPYPSLPCLASILFTSIPPAISASSYAPLPTVPNPRITIFILVFLCLRAPLPARLSVREIKTLVFQTRLLYHNNGVFSTIYANHERL